MHSLEPSTVFSRVVPTEYDVERGELRMAIRSPFSAQLAVIRVPFVRPVALSDDRGRRFTSITLARAYSRAEKAQDPSDPIHRPTTCHCDRGSTCAPPVS